MSQEPKAEALLLPDRSRRKLERLMFSPLRIRSGAMKGDRRSIKRGMSTEFADYRNYAPGDDLRRLDWNVYARLEKPYIKLYEDEEDLAVHILLDASDSMAWQAETEGIPQDESRNKWLFARRILAALAFISLASNDYLSLSPLSNARLKPYGPVRGKAFGVGMLRYVHALKSAGITDLNVELKNYAARTKRPGLVIIISDLFSPSGYLQGIDALLGRGHEVVLIHCLSPEEIDPPMVGDLSLIDIESGQSREVTVDPSMRHLYQQRFEQWIETIRSDCNRRSVPYLFARSDESWEKLIMQDLRRTGILK
ncbi:DUF58 domain-containing protein [Anaerolineales bacterium]